MADLCSGLRNILDTGAKKTNLSVSGSVTDTVIFKHVRTIIIYQRRKHIAINWSERD